MGNILLHLTKKIMSYLVILQNRSAINYLQNLGEGSVDLKLDKTNGVATLFINNPKKKNAMSGRMMVDMYRAVSFLEGWSDGKALVIRGDEDCFCSGGDLDVFSGIASDGRTYEMSSFMTRTMRKMSNLPLISFSYITGRGAFGGGAEIALCSDFCLIHPESKIAFVHATMGVTPAWAGGLRLRERLGIKQALKVCLESRATNAIDALEIGLVDGICAHMSDVENFMCDILRHDVEIVTSVKRTLMSNNLDKCSEIFDNLLGSGSNKKALSAKLKHS